MSEDYEKLKARVTYLEALCNTHEAEVAVAHHHGVELGAAAERARIVGWLRKLNCAGVVPSAVLDNAIDDIERNEHHLEDDA